MHWSGLVWWCVYYEDYDYVDHGYPDAGFAYTSTINKDECTYLYVYMAYIPQDASLVSSYTPTERPEASGGWPVSVSRSASGFELAALNSEMRELGRGWAGQPGQGHLVVCVRVAWGSQSHPRQEVTRHRQGWTSWWQLETDHVIPNRHFQKFRSGVHTHTHIHIVEDK